MAPWYAPTWQHRTPSVKPRLTYQVRGRNAVNDFNQWVKMDLKYIDCWYFWLDVKLLARTAWAVLDGTGK